MPTVTTPITIRGNIIRNRIAMLPMVTFSFKGGGDAYYGKQHVEHYTNAARAGAGLIILQSTNVVGVERGEGMWTAGSLEALRAIARNATAQGATVMMQLAGGSDADGDINDWSTADVLDRQRALKMAAVKAAELGFHGVEYHFAHGFTLCRFMDAAYNQRTDEFGGSLENRLRIVTDILPEVREQVPDNFIISARMGEFVPTAEDGAAAAVHLERCGIDLLDVSFGMRMPEGPVPEGFEFSPVTHSGYAIKRVVSIPVIGVYGIRTPGQARRLVEGGYADMAGVGRAMLADPGFASAVLDGTPYRQCLACKRCFWFTDHTLCPAGKLPETL
ncbi:NADH:flavin oxidoreductase [Pseudodesulfovibrio cashew]|uniref:NADH:flavin oxidoreductase n=1 Tax=Pseudodesulfovibrio cashew TaxID=2678688 RepID=A0A6I6JET2_9BACT|nr:NADH:flavin oxidoreductase [Pseudodesulfovibrio cashew]QGY39679.1 NADH:flavin oxidoreductase [Pseudodesulfovibrio cashew]